MSEGLQCRLRLVLRMCVVARGVPRAAVGSCADEQGITGQNNHSQQNCRPAIFYRPADRPPSPSARSSPAARRRRENQAKPTTEPPISKPPAPPRVLHYPHRRAQRARAPAGTWPAALRGFFRGEPLIFQSASIQQRSALRCAIRKWRDGGVAYLLLRQHFCIEQTQSTSRPHKRVGCVIKKDRNASSLSVSCPLRGDGERPSLCFLWTDP